MFSIDIIFLTTLVTIPIATTFTISLVDVIVTNDVIVVNTFQMF
jgi:hypothetical protein